VLGFCWDYLSIRRRHRPIEFLIPEIFFWPGSPRPFVSSELLAHFGESGRLRLPIKSAKKSLCRGSSPSLGISTCGEIVDVDANCRRYSHTHRLRPPCCISPFHVCHAHHGTSAGTTSSSHGFFLRSAHWFTSYSALKLTSQSRRWEIIVKREEETIIMMMSRSTLP